MPFRDARVLNDVLTQQVAVVREEHPHELGALPLLQPPLGVKDLRGIFRKWAKLEIQCLLNEERGQVFEKYTYGQ